MKRTIIAVSAMLALLLCCGFAFAESMPSAKATAACTNINVISAAQSTVEGPWEPILSSSIKTSEQKDMNIDVSLECGLYTNTNVRSKAGVRDTSTAEASVKVMVVIDAGTDNQRVADPGEVVFCRRTQELTAVFQGLLTDVDGNVCLVADPDTGAITIDEDCLQPEEVGLILDTMNANSFNFMISDLGSGVHTVTVYAKIDLGTDYTNGSADAVATIGKGSAAIEEIRYIQSELHPGEIPEL